MGIMPNGRTPVARLCERERLLVSARGGEWTWGRCCDGKTGEVDGEDDSLKVGKGEVDLCGPSELGKGTKGFSSA